MDAQILIFAAIGFLAQMVDGALGMAFGIIASSSLMAFGAPPALASAAVHAAEVVTTGVSGASHLWHRNVDRELFWRLAVTGIVGGIVGAYVLTELPEDIVRPIVAFYLSAMAVLILLRVFGRLKPTRRPPLPALGGAARIHEAIGGGGWGPLTVSTLVASGGQPRRSIGSVNLAEFFVTIAISATFLTQLDLASYGKVMLGLVLGGVLAAPLAGYLIRILPARVALILVGALVAILSGMNIIRLFA
jgi:uncharacterized membrane protein YfcA